MNKKIAFLLIILSFALPAKAQLTTHKLLNVGYVYQNQSFAEVGGKLLFLSNDNVIYRLGGSALLGETNGKFAIMPKLQGDILLNFQDHVDIYHSHYFLAGAELTSKYVAPKVGVSILGMIDLTAGYAFDLPNQTLQGKTMKGFNFNFGINLPLVLLHDLLK
ncbi:hypothetical protein [Chryseobacterium sp. T1]